MKNLFTVLIVAFFCCVETEAQNLNLRINSTYRPLTNEELWIHAYAEALREKEREKQFNEMQDISYKYYNRGDYNGFIYYSDLALETGWYNSKLYYDRGVAFEKLNEYKKARKEYKKALKKGYYPAQSALTNCKNNEKRWKQRKRK